MKAATAANAAWANDNTPVERNIRVMAVPMSA